MLGETVSLRRPTSGVTDPNDIIDHLMNCRGVQGKEGWLLGHGAQGFMQLVWRNGTDMTEILRHDQVGLRLPQQMAF
jgi:galactokinase/mevalonate kinase-like predicted kinase